MRRGVVASASAALIPLAAHALGVWLAAYKLWPAMRWQWSYPREGVLFESYTLWQVLHNTLSFVASYIELQPASWHRYPPWGYNAFVGLAPWLCAIAVAACLVAGRSSSAAARVDASRFFARGRGGVAFALLLVLVGVVLSLGNGNPASPAFFFRHVPVLDGVRAFNRYQILIVFGLAILVSQSATVISTLLERRSELRRLAIGALAVAVLVPVAAQSGWLTWNILAMPNEDITRDYPPGPAAGPPMQIWNSRPGLQFCGHQTSLLEQGFWIGDCYSNLTLPGKPVSRRNPLYPLSSPAPARIEQITHNSLHLVYDGKLTRRIVPKLRQLDGFRLDRSKRPDGRRLTLRAELPGPREGAAASLCAAVASLIFFSLLARSEWRQRNSSEM